MLKAYSSYFVSYLLDNMRNIKNIEKIILFGSVAKNEGTKESDVDLFIEVKKKTKKFEEEIRKIENKFYESREATLFRTRNISNIFSIKIGKLENWKDLQRSIYSTGIVLYGHYEPTGPNSGKKYFVIIYWNKIGINRGSFLNKIYGFTLKNKHYEGLLEKYKGKKLGKSCVMIPIMYKKEIFDLISKHKVEAKNLEIYV